MKTYRYVTRLPDAAFTDLIGLTLSEVTVHENGDEILFKTVDGRLFLMNHQQECCESVTIESIVGDLQDLVGEPILKAEEVTNSVEDPPGAKVDNSQWRESFMWTFYKLATRKGYVDIRWYGESNGYYSERVDFFELEARIGQ